MNKFYDWIIINSFLLYPMLLTKQREINETKYGMETEKEREEIKYRDMISIELA